MVIIKKLNGKMLKKMQNTKLEYHMTGSHALPDKVFTFIYIYIYIYWCIYWCDDDDDYYYYYYYLEMPKYKNPSSMPIKL